MTKFVRYCCGFLFVAVIFLLAEIRMDSKVPGPCSTPVTIACENSLTGNPASEWDVTGAGDGSIQGFATDVSVNQGQTIGFKVATNAAAYQIDIYRLGYYGGLGARKITTVLPGATLPQTQPACLTDGTTGLVDCGNWNQSASWSVPSAAVSGIYIAKLTRTDTGGSSHMVFVVRDDTGQSDLLMQTSDSTWQAYNQYGGNSLYVGSPAGRAYKVSFNRPYTTRGAAPEDWVFNAEYPMVRWLEANGYNVSYASGVDTDRSAARLLDHKVFLSVGHDEYWSGPQRAAVEAARAAGVHLAFFSGNEVFWKTRYEAGIDGSATPYRTLVSYKETHANAQIDPLGPAMWTGTWRDARFSPPADGGRPENALTGTLFMVNDPGSFPIQVPASVGALRFWRNTSVATLAAGTTAVLPNNTLGYEWDEAPADLFQPAGLIRLSRTTTAVPSKLLDNGSTYGAGTATHSLTLYRDQGSSALVFGAGTVQWSWGLDGTHDRGGSVADLRMKQATLNLLADMGAQPSTPQPGLILASASTDALPPASIIMSPAQGAVIAPGVPVTIAGTALDAGGGTVAAVDVSVDGGATWAPASGTAAWTFSWTPALLGQVTLVSRAVDDSGNIELPVGGVGVTVSSAPAACPCTIWPDTSAPANTDIGSDSSVELGVKFKSDDGGFITALRFYKGPADTGAHVGNLWSVTGTLLASAPFVNESASGWQTAPLTAPIAISSGTTYIASYHVTAGHYVYSSYGFTSGGVDRAPLHALANSVSSNGVYKYGGTSLFPNQTFHATNYWADVVFAETVIDNTAPVVASTSPAAGASAVAPPSQLTATFNEPMDPVSIDVSTFLVRASNGALVSGTVSYDSPTLRAVFTPSSPLAYSASYTANIEGAGAPHATDLAGNPLFADYFWTFTTGATPPPPPDQGPGGPILVVSSPANPFTRYYAEILHAEGLNAFAVADLSTVTAASLAGYDVVVLGEMALTPSQVTLLTTWVNGGGQLIAMRPDKQLAPLVGVADAAATLSDQYMLFNTSSGPGVGLVNQTIQFHGTADLYSLAGAASLATLYSSATTATAQPALTLRQVGPAGGQVAAFAFDLARSVVYTRQGNPAWAGQDRDGLPPIRSDDLFYGGTEVDWVDLSKVLIPQADEQQRLFANLLIQMSGRRKPLPRFWYLPKGYKAAVVMTGDDHANGGTAGRFDQYVSMSQPGCSVGDWECIRSTSYLYANSPLDESAALGYRALGFEVALHVTSGCANYSAISLPGLYATQLADWRARYTTLPAPVTNRMHCIAWSDYATQPQVELDNGIRLDTTYYYWPGSWLLDRPGLFTGSGMPMRFATASGAMTDVYQAATYLTDESGQTIATHIAALLDGALGADGYYGAFTANMHTDQVVSIGSDEILAAALARNVPIISAEQLLTWVDGRNASSFRGLTWDGAALTFTIDIGTGARGLRALLPTRSGNGNMPLMSLTAGGSPVAFTLETIKGIEYATFPATSASYRAVYDPGAPDTAIVAMPPPASASATATFQFTSTLPGGSFQCAGDGAAVSACTSPMTYSSLSQGAHTFAVQAVSASGIVDPTPATYDWTIDLTAPVVTAIAVAPTQASAQLTWVTDDAADGVIDYGTSATALTLRVSDPTLALTHTASLTGLAAGTTYFYRITSTNAVGLSGFAPSATGTSSFATVAIALPDTTITATPAGASSSASATFQFTATIAGSTFQCAADGAAVSACTSPMTYSSLSQGAHTFAVQAVSPSGIVDPTPATYDWTIDLTAPVVTAIAVVPTQTSALVTWVTDDAADGVIDYGTSATALTLRVSDPTLALTHTASLTGLTAGTTYFYRITSTNAVGLSGFAPSATGTSSFATPVVMPPDTAFTSTPPAASNSASATFRFTSTIAGSSFRGSLDGEDLYDYESPITYSGLAQGLHTFSVLAVSPGGVIDPTPATFSWTVDTTAPVLSTIAVVPTQTSATITWVTNELADTVVDYGTSASGLSARVSTATMALGHSANLTGLTAGTTYFYRITSTNAVGLSGFAPSATGTSSFATVAIAPPDTTITATPAGASSSASATFQFTATIAGSTFQCARDGAAFTACASPLTYTALAQGAHTFSVRAVSPDGATDPTPAAFNWSVDTTAPVTGTIAVVPTQTSATMAWVTDDLADTVVDYGISATALTLRVSNSAMALNHSVNLPGLTPGTAYFYRITSKNAAGLFGYAPSATGASTFSTVAPTPPDTTITATPAAVSSSASATFQFTATIAGSTFQCARDGAAFAVCTSPVTYTALAQGAHTFSVKAIGPTGAADSTPASFTWTVDTTAPVIASIEVAPTQTTAVIMWSTNEVADSLVEYGTSSSALTLRVSSSTLGLMHSVSVTGLNPGTTYFYRITSKNAAGLSTSAPSATGASSFATPAPVPPNTTITASPAVSSSSTSASFQFTASIATSTFQCSRDRAAYTTCVSPVTYTSLAAGSHIFSVRAVNAGLTDSTPAAFSWTVDTTPPTTSAVTSIPSLTTAVIDWATNEPADSLVEYATSATSPILRVSSTSLVLNHSLTLTGLTAGTTYYYRITSKNAAGLAGYSPSATTTSSFVTRTQVSQTPSAAVIQTGSLRSGTVANLGSNGNVYYQVNSTTSGTARTAAFYGSVTGVTNSLLNLTVTYSGSNSVNATQVIEIFNWTTNAWVSLNSRSVGTTEVLITGLAPTGAAANYVSGTTGNGDVRVRVRCTGGSSTFYVSSDWLQISFDRP